MFRLFRSSFLTSSIIAIGKMATVILVFCVMLDPSTLTGMPEVMRTSVGILSVTFAALGLLSCFFNLSWVALTAAFWCFSIYCLSTTFLSDGNGGSFIMAKNFPKVLPGGLVYNDIPEAANSIIPVSSTGSKTGGIMESLSSYISNPFSSGLDINSIGLKSANFDDMTFSTGGALPDVAYFGKPAAKRSFYPTKNTGGLDSILTLLTAAR